MNISSACKNYYSGGKSPIYFNQLSKLKIFYIIRKSFSGQMFVLFIYKITVVQAFFSRHVCLWHPAGRGRGACAFLRAEATLLMKKNEDMIFRSFTAYKTLQIFPFRHQAEKNKYNFCLTPSRQSSFAY